jgi:hypothetical protein
MSVRSRERGSPARLRPLAEPHRIAVRADAHGTPVAVREGRRWRRVEAVRERWRIDDEWWRRPIVRIYHKVVLEDGALRTLYHDLESGAWLLHG